MRKVSYLFLIISFFIINLNFMVYASPRGKNENAKEITEKNQQIKTKTKKYKWEFSTAASLDINRELYNGDYKVTTTISVPLRIGYFLSKNFEIEPEINYIHVTINPSYDRKFSYSDALLFTNFVFNIDTPSRVTPFILVGGGIIRISREAIIEPYQMVTSTYSVFDAGAGLKWFAAKRVALRTEYRFIYYKENADTIIHHKIFIGVSIFF